MKKPKQIKDLEMKNNFSKMRRLKALVFLSICFLIAILPKVLGFRPSLRSLLLISLCIFVYGIFVILSHFRLQKNKSISNKQDLDNNRPVLDILVAARDEQNVIRRLVERLFNLDYPEDKLNIYIIDDGSVDKTPLILESLSQKYKKLKIIKRLKDAGGGKSGALNHALKFTNGEWIFILDADAQIKNDTLLRALDFAYKGSWSAVQLRKAVLNTSKNMLTACQSIEMVMDALFQIGRLSTAGISELRGNGQLIKKELLINSGSFNEDTVTDDLDLSIRLLLSQSQIGILWDPPVMEEAVESVPALISQRQRWAEGGLQRFFDYGNQLIFGKLRFIQKFDLFYFFILQYGLPTIALFDISMSLIFKALPIYWPISLTAFSLSAIASWFGLRKKSESSILPEANFWNMFFFLIYLSHWFLIIPFVTIKMSIFPKKILWKKTLHKG